LIKINLLLITDVTDCVLLTQNMMTLVVMTMVMWSLRRLMVVLLLLLLQLTEPPVESTVENLIRRSGHILPPSPSIFFSWSYCCTQLQLL